MEPDLTEWKEKLHILVKIIILSRTYETRLIKKIRSILMHNIYTDPFVCVGDICVIGMHLKEKENLFATAYYISNN